MDSTAQSTHRISLEYYTLEHLQKLIEERPRLLLDGEVEARIDEGARFVQAKGAEDRYIYGVNTGFGSLCETRVAEHEMEALQWNHVVSHACGVGEIVPEHISRLVMIIKILTFRTGRTGITSATVKAMLDLWNHDVIPAIPQKGTVGASGDLAPLAHMALPLLGLGKVHYRGRIVAAAEVLKELGLEPVRLKPKEGLALTNGVQYINAFAAHCLMRSSELVKAADVVAAMSTQAFSASRTFYDPRYHETSLHEDRRVVAANLVKLLSGSNHFELPSCNRSMQDPYSFRCAPQVHAAVRQAFRFAKKTIEDECNSVSDNPLFFPEHDAILFGGNLHGESTAMALDFLAIAMSELANISERRTYQLLSGQRGLPSFLIKQPGLNSGFMVVQYTSAALVNQNKVLCTPASIDTIPTCQLQEDHVSMGGTSAYKLCELLTNCESILSIELLTAAQAIDLNPGLRLSAVTARVQDGLRARVGFLERDRVMSEDMEKALAYFCEQKRAWSTELGLG
jgi:histidine ammonia-lyase